MKKPKNYEDLQRLYTSVYEAGNIRTEKGWAGRYGDHSQRDVQILQYVEKVFPKPERQRILDASCGRGHLLQELLRRGFDARGTEIVPLLLERDLKHFPVTIKGYHELRDFGEGAFDMVISSDVLEHLLSEKMVREAVENLCFISKRYVVISTGLRPARTFPAHVPAVKKITPDLHFFLRRATWWREFLSKYIDIKWTYHNKRFCYCFGVKR
ncbi:MAG: methyltransferase domain-containing protein [Candidatus Latescibacterota bacterium]|nr:MAG: methyltransferase domain-containing protein [Candidatus Latescibacterota bacterium]